MEVIQHCPKCSSKKFVKHGKVKGKQPYLCKSCGYKFTVNKLGKSLEKFYVVKALQLYLEGLGFRSIERILVGSHVTVMNWVKKYGKDLSFVRLDSNGEQIVVEVDEYVVMLVKKKLHMGLDCC